MTQKSNLFLSIGKPVKDEYGRSVGKVASFALTPNGKFDAVFIELNDGKFARNSLENLKFNGSEVTLISKIKSNVNVLCDQLPLIWRKDQALKNLAEKGKISPDLYNEIHNNFEGVLNQLKVDAQSLSEDIDEELARCDEEIKTLNYAVVHLELEHEIGKIADEHYRAAFGLIQDSIKRMNTEKSDLEHTKSKLSNVLLGDSPAPEEEIEISNEPIDEKTALPEPPAPEAQLKVTDEPTKVIEEPTEEKAKPQDPPVVVYVKEIGKAGL